MNPTPFPEVPLRGYAEGYYGRLLSWGERLQIVQTLEALHMNVWLYAPKEDPCHRLRWRRSWDANWTQSFAGFCTQCRSRGIYVIAGLAPGLDFDFAALAARERGGADVSPTPVSDTDLPLALASDGNTVSGALADDYSILLEKVRFLLVAGADYIALLMDDIDPDFAQRAGHFQSEGRAHAALANRLGDDLNICVLVVPRIYANELVIEDLHYLPDFADVLDLRHLISHCGENVVSRVIAPDDCVAHLGNRGHRVVLWDNLYANDYCPRRLFVGEWTGREAVSDVVLNPTGMPYTDQLLLELMASQSSGLSPSEGESNGIPILMDQGDDSNGGPTKSRGKILHSAIWRMLMDQAGVPTEFDLVADHCWHPFCNGDSRALVAPADLSVEAMEKALDALLWRWKTPLALEWYPYLMGLRQDLICRSGTLPDLRIMKTQNWAMASELLDPRK